MTATFAALVDAFSAPYMQRAGLMVLLLSVIGAAVGLHVVVRRLSFFTEALHHTVFPGVVIAFLAGSSVLVGAGSAAALTVVLFTYLSRRSNVNQDSVLALLVSGFFALGVVIVSRSSSFQHDMESLLFGRLLTVDVADLWQTAIAGVVVLAALVLAHKELMLSALDRTSAEAMGYDVRKLDLLVNACIAVAVVLAVRAIGTVLLLAFLVTPAAAAKHIFRSAGTIAIGAFVISATSALVGLLASYELSVAHSVDVPPGATVVLCISTLSLLTVGGRKLFAR